MERPALTPSRKITPIQLQKYERYLPTAFDESLSLLQKINKVIEELFQLGQATNDVIDKWNEVMLWILNDGLDEVVLKRLNEMLENGELDRLISELMVIQIQKDITYTVGENGDYETINDALKAISKQNLVYDNQIQANVKILSGHIVKEQILLDKNDLSYITIISEDSEVPVNGASLTKLFGDENKYPLFGGKNGAKLPVINVLFNMDSSEMNGSRDGVYLERNSTVIIGSGKGVKNAKGFGLRAWEGCTVLARGAIFTNALERGCMVSQGTVIVAPNIDLSGAKGRNGFRAYRGVTGSIEYAKITDCAEVAVRISEGSTITMAYADCSNAGLVNSEGDGQALRVFGASSVYASHMKGVNSAGHTVQVSSGSTVALDNADLTRSGGIALNVYGASTAYAADVKLDNATQECVRASSQGVVDVGGASMMGAGAEASCVAEYGGRIHAGDSNASGNQVGYRALHAGVIDGIKLNADRCGIGFDMYWQGEINARSSHAIGCRNSARVSTGSKFVCTDSDLSGYTEEGVNTYRGSDAYLYETNCRKASSDLPTDIIATAGAIVRANKALGGFNKAINTIDENGIIFY